jgi:hypothetical protein
MAWCDGIRCVVEGCSWTFAGRIPYGPDEGFDLDDCMIGVKPEPDNWWACAAGYIQGETHDITHAEYELEVEIEKERSEREGKGT